MSAITTESSSWPLPRKWPLWYALDPVAALPTAARMARAHVRDVLGQWGLRHFEEDAILVTSELVANVVNQCHDSNGKPVYLNGHMPLLQLSMYSDSLRLLITLWDQAPGIPQQRNPDDDAETGRGLAMIARLGQWDWRPADSGKTVRVLLRTTAGPSLGKLHDG
jgi:anti-sigma regulatory factor (Ser/Thr protein kinase)